MDRVTSPSFVGRAEPLARLRAALDRAGEGLAGVHLVAGEAGVGKTRLLGEVIDHAHRASACVLAGGCVDLGEVSLPYAPVVEALRGLMRERGPERMVELAGGDRAELARLLPELADGGRGPDPAGEHASSQARLFDFVLRLLERLWAGVGATGGQPVLVVLEDLHWADRSTLDLLTFLARNLQDCGVLLVATYRSDELHRRHPLRPVLAELERSGRVERSELPRFDRDEVVEQLEGILGEPPTKPLAEDIWRRSEGNAFFVEELVAAARAGDGRALPPTLRDILIARLEHMPESAQHVLRVAAAAGYRVDHRLLAAVAGLPIAQLLEALRLAVTNLVLIPDDLGEAYTFRHALVQEALYGELLPGERTALHTSFAEAISSRPELAANPAAALAHHWYRAHDLARALPATVQAGDDAKHAYAFAEAQQHYERALSLWEKVPAAAATLGVDRVALLHRAAQCAYLSGDLERAHALMTAAIAELDAERDPALAGLLHARLGRYRWLLGRSDAFDAYEKALALVPSGPSPERARALASYGAALMLASRYAESKPVCEEAIEVAREVGARSAEADALDTLGVNLVHGFGEAEEGLRRLREALALAERAGAVDERARAWINLTAVLDHVGRHAEALAAAEAGAEDAVRLGVGRTDGENLRAMAADQLLTLGRWGEAERALPRVSPGAPARSKSLKMLLWVVIRLHTLRGDFDRAGAHLETFRQAWAEDGLALGAHRLAAELALWRRRPDEALRSVEVAVRLAKADDGKLIDLVPLGLWAAADLAEQARARGDDAGAAEAARAAAGLRDRLDIPDGPRRLPRLAAQLAEVGSHWARVHGSADAAVHREVAQRWEALGDVHKAACARWRQAEALAAAGAARAQVVEVLVPALATARSLGAAPLVERLEALARRVRVDLSRPDAEAPEPAAAAGLTPREAEVLALVAAGRTNRQIGEELFISAKTASVHVSNILAKLGVASRAEASATAWRLGLVPDGLTADGPAATPDHR